MLAITSNHSQKKTTTRAIRTPIHAVPQHSVELGFGYREAAGSTGYWGAWCRFDVVYRVVAHLPRGVWGSGTRRRDHPPVCCSQLSLRSGTVWMPSELVLMGKWPRPGFCCCGSRPRGWSWLAGPPWWSEVGRRPPRNARWNLVEGLGWAWGCAIYRSVWVYRWLWRGRSWCTPCALERAFRELRRGQNRCRSRISGCWLGRWWIGGWKCRTGVYCHQRQSLPFSCLWKEHGGVHLRALSLNRRWYWQ